MQKMTEEIKRQLSEGNIKGVEIDDFPEIEKLLCAVPTSRSPNQPNYGMSKIPGVNLLSTFQEIEISQIAAVEELGETLKDAVVTIGVNRTETRQDEWQFDEMFCRVTDRSWALRS
jgi:hypothetical protein